MGKNRPETMRAYVARNADKIKAQKKEAWKRTDTPERRATKRAVAKAWRLNNPEKAKASGFACGIRRRYKLSLARYLCTLLQQDYKCARCRGSSWGTRIKRPHIDHDHQTGAFRGLLCLWCNQMLGHLGDTRVALRDAHRSYDAYLGGRL